MRLLLCSAVLATALLGVYGFPADLEVPKKGGNPNNRPQQSSMEKPRPNLVSKPSPQVSDSLQASESPSAYVLEVAQSIVSSELSAAPAEVPADHAAAPEVLSNPVQEPAHDPILETANNFPDPQAVLQDAIPGAEAPEAIEAETLSVDHAVIADAVSPAANNFPDPEAVLQDAIPEAEAPEAIEAETLSVDHAVVADAVSAAADQAPEIDASAHQIAVDMDGQLEKSNVKVSVSSKSRRHVGVEQPTALRIGDFEDVEVDTGLAAAEYPANQEQVEATPGISKEEMILMAMEQNGMHPNLPNIQLQAPRPAKGRPNLMNSGLQMNSGSIIGKPHSYQSESFEDDEETDESNEDDQAVDLRNAGEAATIVQEQPSVPVVPKAIVPKGIPEPSSPSPYGNGGSRNKPRPYGMDRPSKNRPTLDSGMKDKNEHFGLPHSSSSNDYNVQKGEHGTSSESGTTSYLGFQIPSIKWTSFSDIFPNFWGTRNRHHGLGKSDAASEQAEPCVDSQDSAGEGVRSPVIQASTLCHASGVMSKCQEACVSNGFASGSCLGPYPTPGCLCRMPKSNEFGLLLQPLEEKSPVPDANRVQDLETSASPTCKKCACLDSCKKSGSYTGFCLDRCYCAVPWYNKQEA